MVAAGGSPSSPPRKRWVPVARLGPAPPRTGKVSRWGPVAGGARTPARADAPRLSPLEPDGIRGRRARHVSALRDRTPLWPTCRVRRPRRLVDQAWLLRRTTHRVKRNPARGWGGTVAGGVAVRGSGRGPFGAQGGGAEARRARAKELRCPPSAAPTPAPRAPPPTAGGPLPPAPGPPPPPGRTPQGASAWCARRPVRARSEIVTACALCRFANNRAGHSPSPAPPPSPQLTVRNAPSDP